MTRGIFIVFAIVVSAIIATAGSWLEPLIEQRNAAATLHARAILPTAQAAPVKLPPLAARIADAPTEPPVNVTAAWTTLPDTADDTSPNRFVYYGSGWAHVAGFRDGRLNGTSSRSDHKGDIVSVHFTGQRIAVFGVDGRAGGFAKLLLDGTPVGQADFFSSAVGPKIVYMSPRLVRGPHKLAITVSGDRPEISDGGFVNINYAKIQP